VKKKEKDMPIFEFRCLECGSLFEKLFVGSQEKVDLQCPECESSTFERVLSRSSHVMGVGPGGKRPKITEKSCAPGNKCMTLDLPGPTK
jgi:putative FmdB family regulatory protein